MRSDSKPHYAPLSGTRVGPIWQDWQTMLLTLTVVLGPWFVYRAWKRH